MQNGITNNLMEYKGRGPYTLPP